jgi:hypothetical protein
MDAAYNAVRVYIFIVRQCIGGLGGNGTRGKAVLYGITAVYPDIAHQAPGMYGVCPLGVPGVGFGESFIRQYIAQGVTVVDA